MAIKITNLDSIKGSGVKNPEPLRQNWYSGDSPTTRDVLGRISEIYDHNKLAGTFYSNQFFKLQQDSSSPFYDPYASATNKAVNELASYGVDTSVIDDKFFADNDYLRSYLKYNGSANTPSAPGKKASTAEKAAYAFYQIWKSEDKTKKAESQWNALQDELTYWAKRTDRNYTDDEIINKVDWSKYGELTSMDTNKLMQPNEYNRAIGYSKDAMYGVIWAARNNGGTGDVFSDMAMSARGKGNTWQYNPEINAKLDPNSPEFHPYSIGTTNLDNEAMYFNVDNFSEDFINKNKHLVWDGNDTEKKYMGNILEAYDNWNSANAATTALKQWEEQKLGKVKDQAKAKQMFDDLLDTGYLYVKADKDGNVKVYNTKVNGAKKIDLNILNKMDESVGKNGQYGNGRLIPMTGSVDYKYDNYINHLNDVCVANAEKGNGGTFSDTISDNATSGVETGRAVAGDNKGKPAGIHEQESEIDAVSGAVPAYGKKTQQEKAIAEEQDKTLSDGITAVDSITTPSESSVFNNAGSVTFDWVRGMWTSLEKEIDAFKGIAEGNKQEVMDTHASETLANFQTIYDYEMNQQAIESMELELDALKKEAGDSIYAGQTTTDNAGKYITVNGKSYYVKLSNIYSDDGSYYIDSINQISNGDPYNVDDATYAEVEQDQQVQQFITDYNTKYQAINGNEQREWTEDEINRANRIRELELQIDDMKEQNGDKTEAYQQSVKAFDDAQIKREQNLYVMKSLGLDTADLEKEYAVVGYLVNYGKYEQTVWSEYNPSDAYRIALAQGEDRDTVLAQAKKGNDQVTTELETAREVRAYLEKTGLKVPANYISNLDRHIAKLERDQKDYEYFALSQNKDWEEMVRKGREEEYEQRPQQWSIFRNPELDWSMEEYYQHMNDEYDELSAFADYGLRGIAGMFARQMTEDEKNTYYYLMGKGDKDAAADYVSSLTDMSYGVLHTRFTNELKENTAGLFRSQKSADFQTKEEADRWIEENGKKNKDYQVSEDENGYHIKWTEASAGGFIGANILAILASPAAAMASLGYLGYSVISGDEMNPDNALLMANTFRSTTREQSAKEITDYFGEGTIGQKLVQSFYEIVSNRLDSLVNGFTFGGLTSGIGNNMLNELAGASPMGLSAAMDAMMEAKRKGASDAQAYGIGLVTFLAETGTEAVSLDNIKEAFKIGKDVTMDGLKSFMKNWLTKAGLSEMVGETLNEIIESKADELIMGDKSEHNDRVWAYRMQGYSKEDADAMARMDELKNLMHTALISYLSPGLDVVSYAAGRTNYYRQKTRASQQMGDSRSLLQILRDEKVEAQQQEQVVDNHEPGPIQAMPEQTAEPVHASAEQINEEQNIVPPDVTDRTGTVQEPAPQQGAIEVVNAPETAGTAVEENTGVTLRQDLEMDFEALESALDADTSSQTATVAFVLDYAGTEESSDTAKAAAMNMDRLTMGESSSAEYLQDIILGAHEADVDGALVKQAIQTAALSESSSAYQMMQTGEYIHADLEQRAQMLAETVEADNANTVVQSEITKAVYENRVAEAERTLIVNGGLKQTNAQQETVTNAQKQVSAAQKQLEEKQNALDEATADVEQKAQAVAENPTDDNMKQHADAVTRADNADESRKQYEQHLAKTEDDLSQAEGELDRIRNEEMTALRQQAQEMVAQQDQQRQVEAEAIAEQQRQFAAEQAEAERQQKIADQRSGKTAEESARAKIQRLAEARGYTGEQAEQFVNDVMNFWQTGQVNKIDMSKQFSKSEGYLMMGALARRFGVNVEIGEIATGENGYYDPATNTIRLNSNLPAGQILVEFAEHEFTHTLEQMKAYKQYHDAALNILYQSDAELNDAVAKKMAEYEDNGHPINEDQAKKELVAEFTRLKLNDKAVVQRMVDSGMGGRIRNALHNINQFLKNIRLTGEARTEAENLRRTERLFQKAIRERSRAQAKARTEAIKQANTPAAKMERSATPVVENSQGDAEVSEVRGGTISRTDGDTEYSVASWTDEEKQRVRNQLKDRMMSENDGSMTESEMDAKIDKWINDVNDIAYIITQDRNRLDYTADPEKTMLKPNAEYVKTLDASTLCAKRLLYQGTFDAIQHQLPNTPLMPEDLIDLANMMREMGYEAPCGICYVESRRRQLGKFTEQWLESYEGEYKPTLDEVTTSDGLERLRSAHPQAYQDFISAMNKKGTMNPKVVQLRTDYRGEISQMTPAQVQKVKDIGGLRIQSFSDFETPHLIDMMQAVMDMSSQKLTAQAYTKVPNFPWVFGDTGIKINLSLIGKGTGLDGNGNLLFDDVEGMPFEEAMKLRDRYSNNVGTILVGINDQHILAAMADDRIDFIIPFHKSGWSKEELTKMPVLNGYSDYTDSQNEKAIVGRDKNGKYKTESLDKSKRVNFQPVGENGYWDFSKSGKENAETYLKMCAEDGRLPKFSQFLVDNGDGSFSLQPNGSTDGYWKTLIDFKMYDNEGNGAPQQEVNPNFNMDEARRVLDEYSLERNGVSRESNNDLPVAQEVVDAYVQKYKDEHPGREYSTGMSEMTDAQRAQALQEANVDYQDAVSRGDMEAAQEDVDFYSEQKGYTDDAYHGTDFFGFTQIDMEKSQGQIFVAYGEDIAGSYTMGQARELGKSFMEGAADNENYELANRIVNMGNDELVDFVNTDYANALARTGVTIIDAHIMPDGKISFTSKGKAGTNTRTMDRYTLAEDALNYMDANRGIYRLRTRPGNQLVVDANGARWKQIEWNPNDGETSQTVWKTRELGDWAKAHGYDSVRINNVIDNGENGPSAKAGDIGIFFNQDDVKSADPVTYDDNGNMIPLDQRFSDSPDIRYSVENNQMTDSERNQALIDAGLMTEEEAVVEQAANRINIEGLTDAENEMLSASLPRGDKGNAQRQWGRKGAQQSDELDSRVKEYLLKNNMYTKDTNEEQINRALNWIRSNRSQGDPDGYYASLQQVNSKKFNSISPDGQAKMVAMMAMAAAKNDLYAQVQLADTYNRQGTLAGQTLQARKLFRLMTPEGRIATLQKMLGDVQAEVENRGGDGSNITFSEWIYRAAAAAETEDEFSQVRDAAAEELGAQIPANWKEKLTGFRMLAMLGNPRTHIRNIAGNALFMPAVGIKNKVGAVLESMFLDEGERTKTIGFATKEARDFAKDYSLEIEDVLRGEAKYNDQDKVRQNTKTWGTGDGIISRTIGKALQAYSDLNGNALEWEDWLFLRRHFRNAMAGYMTANKLTAADMTGETLENAASYAISEAQKATYRDPNSLATALGNIASKGQGTKVQTGAKAIQGIVNAVLPFKKTPANILRRGVEYSPVGLVSAARDVKAMVDTVRYQEGKTDKAPKRTVTPAQFIDKIASGLTGSGVMALGFALAMAGVARGGFDYEEPEDKIAQLEGEQEYGVNFGKLGNIISKAITGAELFGEDVTRTMDWAAPMSMPFFVGVVMNDIFKNANPDDDDETLMKKAQGVLESLLSITEPVFNLSMLDGVNRLFKINTSNSKAPALDIAFNIALNYASSYVPTILGQVARTVDPTRRATYVESGAFLSQFWKTVEQVQNKIPGASSQNIPYMDAFGQEQTNTVFNAALENFLAPWYKSELAKDDVTQEIKRVYNETKISTFIPGTAPKQFKVGKTQYKLTDKEYETFQKDQGEAWYNTINDLIKTDEYQMADDVTKAGMLDDCRTYAMQSAKYHIDNKFNADKWVVNAMQSGNVTQTIINNAIERNRKEFITDYSYQLAKALDSGDDETKETLMEGLEQARVSDSYDVARKVITEYFKPIYQKADEDERDDIEEMLIDLDFGYRSSDIHKWAAGTKNEDEEEEDEDEEAYDNSRWLQNNSSSALPARYIASAGMSDSSFSNRTASMPERPASDNSWDQYMSDLDDYWADYDFASNDPVGQYGQGNIDLDNRQTVQNDDGSISTEQSFSFYDEQTGKEVLIPLIADGRVMTQDEAIDRYYETGEYLGMFDDWHDADEYATMLHNRQDWYYHQ